MGLPGGWRRRNRAYNGARSSPTSPGSAEALFGDAGGLSVFLHRFSAAWGVLGLYMFVPFTALVLGDLKVQETRGWFLTTRVFWHFLCPQRLETPQGVPLDSLGVGAVKIGHIIVPDPSPMSPGSAEAHSSGSGGIFAFSDRTSVVWGPWGLYLLVPCVVLWLGGLKKRNIAGGF
jgi:hypothetical protein